MGAHVVATTHGMMQRGMPCAGRVRRRATTRVKSLDDMAEREMAKQQQKQRSQGKFTSAKEFDELVKAMPDPAGEQDGLLADGTSFLCLFRLVYMLVCCVGGGGGCTRRL